MRVSIAAVSLLVCLSVCQDAKAQNAGPADKGNAAHRAAIEKAIKAMADGRRKPIHVSMGKEYAAERKIHAAMKDETAIEFVETPLADALQVVSKIHDIPIVVDRRALEEIGLSPDEPVTLSLKNVTLKSAMRLMLRDLDLTYMIKDEVMQITTIEAAEYNLVFEMYALPEDLAAKSDKIIKVMQQSVVPDTWSTLGGPSMATSIDGVLMVSTTTDIHHQIEEFLAKLLETRRQ